MYDIKAMSSLQKEEIKKKREELDEIWGRYLKIRKLECSEERLEEVKGEIISAYQFIKGD